MKRGAPGRHTLQRGHDDADSTERTDQRALYGNRELGLLAFNRRVLAQAGDAAYPLLERLRFLRIVSGNLDEFFEIRVAGVKAEIQAGAPDAGPDGERVSFQRQLDGAQFFAPRGGAFPFPMQPPSAACSTKAYGRISRTTCVPGTCARMGATAASGTVTRRGAQEKLIDQLAEHTAKA